MAGRGWLWTAQGKHPLAKDFLHLGPDLPAAQALARWVDIGFHALTNQGGPQRPYSWRFWASSSKADHLLCGLLRGSCDGVGRAYPLLFLGAGVLPGWERRWECLPGVFEPLWRRLEALASHKFRDIDQFREELGRVGSPAPPYWGPDRSMAGRIDRDQGNPLSLCSPEMKEMVAREANRGEVFIPLEATSTEELQDLLSSWHLWLKGANGASPSAVFIGGLPEWTCLAVFRQALGLEHFVRLWTAAPAVAGCGA